MREVVIVSAVRTAIGSFHGGLSSLSATDLGAIVIKAALRKAQVPPNQVDEVIFGNALQAGLGQNPARQAAMNAGIPVETPSYTVNKVCGSGLKTVNLAAQAILCGDAEIVVAGGMESMTNAPYLLDAKARWGYRMGDARVVDVMIQDGLWCAFNEYHMGITAENIANQFGITRQDQDQLAYESQTKAARSIAAGRFKDEIVPITIKDRKGVHVFSADEYPKSDITVKGMSELKPAFKRDGTVTAANASGINDGAAALVVMSAQKAQTLGIKPLVKIRAYSSSGVDPSIMGIGPVPATQKALAKAGLRMNDLDLIEANEAFAAQFLQVEKELDLPKERVNIRGGAIALGHPIGASGARILVTLIHSLIQNHQKIGLATLCVGGGQGVATIVERI